jgi:hypothetical protein
MTDKLSEDFEEKQGFAREQYEFLKENGVDDRLRRSRIFKAAGPGQVKEAWKLAHCENFEENEIRKNLLLCILGGSKKVNLEREQMEAVLEAVGFPIPQAYNNRCFFRILNGAGEILQPGFFRFSRRDMEIIDAGLKKRVYED